MGRPGKLARPTIYDVAREAGVSKSLVSLVLNGSHLVAEPKREAVQRAIEKLGYRRSRAAATLAGNRTRTVGLVIDDFSNPWFVELLAGIRHVMGPHGFHVAVREHYWDGERWINAIDGFLDTQVDALVVAAEPGREFGPLDVPVVLEGTRLHGIQGADHVASDQAHGVDLLMNHLRQAGHERIGHVTGEGGSAAKRLEAYLDFMARAGLEPRFAGIGRATNEDGGYLGAVELLREHPDVTALFAANDTMALGVRAALREAGREVPRDVALIGFDNSQLARSRFLDLTTVDNHAFDAGVACAEALMRRMSEPEAPPRTTSIPCRLVCRSTSSTARPTCGPRMPSSNAGCVLEGDA